MKIIFVLRLIISEEINIGFRRGFSVEVDVFLRVGVSGGGWGFSGFYESIYIFC